MVCCCIDLILLLLGLPGTGTAGQPSQQHYFGQSVFINVTSKQLLFCLFPECWTHWNQSVTNMTSLEAFWWEWTSTLFPHQWNLISISSSLVITSVGGKHENYWYDYLGLSSSFKCTWSKAVLICDIRNETLKGGKEGKKQKPQSLDHHYYLEMCGALLFILLMLCAKRLSSDIHIIWRRTPVSWTNLCFLLWCDWFHHWSVFVIHSS